MDYNIIYEANTPGLVLERIIGQRRHLSLVEYLVQLTDVRRDISGAHWIDANLVAEIAPQLIVEFIERKMQKRESYNKCGSRINQICTSLPNHISTTKDSPIQDSPTIPRDTPEPNTAESPFARSPHRMFNLMPTTIGASRRATIPESNVLLAKNQSDTTGPTDGPARVETERLFRTRETHFQRDNHSTPHLNRRPSRADALPAMYGSLPRSNQYRPVNDAPAEDQPLIPHSPRQTLRRTFSFPSIFNRLKFSSSQQCQSRSPKQTISQSDAERRDSLFGERRPRRLSRESWSASLLSIGRSGNGTKTTWKKALGFGFFGN